MLGCIRGNCPRGFSLPNAIGDGDSSMLRLLGGRGADVAVNVVGMVQSGGGMESLSGVMAVGVLELVPVLLLDPRFSWLSSLAWSSPRRAFIL